MELQGRVIAALPERSGTSARGDWKSQEFVIETANTAYPRKMVFTVFGADRLQRFGIQVGQDINVSFDIDAHEWNGRWYNNITAFDVRQVSAVQPMATEQPAYVAPQPASPQPAAPTQSAGDSAEDLPF